MLLCLTNVLLAMRSAATFSTECYKNEIRVLVHLDCSKELFKMQIVPELVCELDLAPVREVLATVTASSFPRVLSSLSCLHHLDIR